jgi:hypothetical protein
VKNEAGNLNLSLSMTTNTWSATPTNTTTNVADVTWNKGGTVLAPGQNATAILTLTVADNAETQAGLSFDVNVKIIGDETP